MPTPNKKNAQIYYDRFASVYDWISSNSYYQKPREYAIKKLDIQPGHSVLNVPCGTGQNFSYFEEDLQGTGQIIGIDLSDGMLAKARKKIKQHHWANVQLFQADVTKLDRVWINENIQKDLQFDGILCDLGLSGFPNWQSVIDQLISLLKPAGKFVIMDWYIAKPNLRAAYIKWLGRGEVDRPLYQYAENKLSSFELDTSFKKGEMFVASGTKKEET